MTEHEKIRRYLWMSIATSVARSGTPSVDTFSNKPGEWADVALAAFDKTFQPLEDKHD